MSSEDVEKGLSLFLQIGALLGIVSTAIYLFISLKNYFKTAREDRVKMEKAQQENIERVKKSITEEIMRDLGSKLERNVTEMQRMNELIVQKDVSAAENKKRLEEVDKWRIEIEKKFIVLEMQFPSIKSIKADIEAIKNNLMKALK